MLTDPDRAEMIAATETNRAVTTATMAEYEVDGVPMFDILLSDRLCDECEANANGGPYRLDQEPPNGLPPTHPNCLCAVAPHYPDD